MEHIYVKQTLYSYEIWDAFHQIARVEIFGKEAVKET